MAKKRTDDFGIDVEQFGKPLYLPLPEEFKSVGSEAEQSSFAHWLELFKELFAEEATNAQKAFDAAWHAKLDELITLISSCSKWLQPFMKASVRFVLNRFGIKHKV